MIFEDLNLFGDLFLVFTIIAAYMPKIVEHLLRRDIDPTPKNFPLRREQNHAGPAILIIALIDIWSYIAINPYWNVIMVQNRNNRGFGEGRLIHNMAPLAPGRGNQQENGLV